MSIPRFPANSTSHVGGTRRCSSPHLTTLPDDVLRLTMHFFTGQELHTTACVSKKLRALSDRERIFLINEKTPSKKLYLEEKPLLHLLQRNQGKVTKLNIDEMPINNITAILNSCGELMSFSAKYCSAGKDTITLTTHPKILNIRALYLNGNNIEDAGIKHIAKALKHLVTLDLSQNCMGSAGALAIAKKLKRLSFLDVEQNGIKKKGLRALTSMQDRGVTVII